MKIYTKRYLIRKLNELYNINKRNPTSLDLGGKYNMPDRSVYENRFGSFNNSLIKAGLKVNVYRRNWTKKQIIKWLKYKYKELEKTPGIRDFDNDPRTPGKNTVRKMFGNWTNALRKANIPLKRFISKKELIKILKRLAKKLNRTPNKSDLNELNRTPSSNPFVRKFGSYTKACLMAGLNPNFGTNNNVWKAWENHCIKMARIIYKKIEVQKRGKVKGIPDIYIPSKGLFIDAKTCGYEDFKDQIKRYSKKHKLEFWLIFKGIETKKKNVKYIYAEELGKKMRKLGRYNLANKCHQFIKNINRDTQ